MYSLGSETIPKLQAFSTKHYSNNFHAFLYVQEMHGTHDVLDVEQDQRIDETSLPHPTEDPAK